jgi:REP element-mobilizing transposase RayT
VTWGVSALRFPQGSGCNTWVRQYPKLPPRLRWIFPHHPVLFVPFCTYRRRKFLASDRIHAAFLAFAADAYTKLNVAVGRYVIMPEHIHLFVHGSHDFELGRWIAMLKQKLGKQIEESRSDADLAARVLRSCFAQQSKLRPKMELRSPESSPGW